MLRKINEIQKLVKCGYGSSYILHLAYKVDLKSHILMILVMLLFILKNCEDPCFRYQSHQFYQYFRGENYFFCKIFKIIKPLNDDGNIEVKLCAFKNLITLHITWVWCSKSLLLLVLILFKIVFKCKLLSYWLCCFIFLIHFLFGLFVFSLTKFWVPLNTYYWA